MASFLENAPRDVLQYIALLVATSSEQEPSRHLLQLLLTSSAIYHSLSIHASPHLYANIFRTKFDIVQDLPERLTDSALAAEWVRRCCLLRRVRRGNLTSEGSQQDLWAALRMILENHGLNDAHLLAAGFPEFIMAFAKAHPPCDVTVSSAEYEVSALAIWLLCFTLSHQGVIDASEKTREEFITLLRPFATSVMNFAGININRLPSLLPEFEGSSHGIASNVGIDSGEKCQAVHNHQRPFPACPEPSSAAIILTFALNEALPLAIPTHLPENRAIAIATHRSGPTMEDFRTVASCRTPLFVDIRHELHASSAGVTDPDHSVKYDVEFGRVLRLSYDLVRSDSICPYVPGTFTGTWEGSYMLSNVVKPKIGGCVLGDFTCRKPMQWAISEYRCFSPHLPLPKDDVFSMSLSLGQSQAGFETCLRTLGYEKHDVESSDTLKAQRDPSEALDILVVGETLPDHEQAWGGFRFAGRITPDGLIVVRREPKNADDESLGTWIFEGRLRYGVALVGNLRSSIPTDNCDIRGIFSLRKIDTPQE